MRYLGIGLVCAYRMTFGALFPTTCKYHPSCSQYAIDALRRYGLLRGSVLAGWRLLRCHPWARGGADQPQEVALDPLAREVVRDGDGERVVGELDTLGFGEPRAVRGVVERPLEPTGNF